MKLHGLSSRGQGLSGLFGDFADRCQEVDEDLVSNPEAFVSILMRERLATNTTI